MNKTRIGLVAAILCVVGAGFFVMSRRPAEAPQPVAPPAQPAASPEMPQSRPLPAMSLEESDTAIRERAKGLSASPAIARWLKTDNIIRRIVAAAAIIAEGKGPKDSLGFLAPGKPFSVLRKKGGLYVNPKSYRRYDAVGDAFQSLDAAATARLFKDLKPLFQKAYEELGHSNRGVQETLLQAINAMLETPVVVGDIRLRPKVVSYAMADERLEKLSPAQKHLLRMGPENTAKIQNKLRETAVDLGTPEARLSKSETYVSPVK